MSKAGYGCTKQHCYFDVLAATMMHLLSVLLCSHLVHFGAVDNRKNT